jgi:hypothetical protein
VNWYKYSIPVAGLAASLAGLSMMAAAGPNLFVNPDFEAGIAGWNLAGSGVVESENGHLKLTNTFQGPISTYPGAMNCVSGIEDGVSYIVTGEALVEEAAPPNTGAYLVLYFYTDDNCTTVDSTFGAPMDLGGFVPAERGHWITLRSQFTAPATVKSAHVKLTAAKEPPAGGPGISAPSYVWWDNLYFGPNNVAEADPTPEPPTPAPADPAPPTPPPANPGDSDGPLVGYTPPVLPPPPGPGSESEAPGEGEPFEPPILPSPAPASGAQGGEGPSTPPATGPSTPPTPADSTSQEPDAPATPSPSVESAPQPPATGNGLSHPRSSRTGLLLMLAGGLLTLVGGGATLATRRAGG